MHSACSKIYERPKDVVRKYVLQQLKMALLYIKNFELSLCLSLIILAVDVWMLLIPKMYDFAQGVLSVLKPYSKITLRQSAVCYR